MNSDCVPGNAISASRAKSFRWLQCIVVCCSVVGVQLCSSLASATPEVIQPIDTGWYWLDSGGYLHQPSNTNFIVGHEDVNDREYRNFFVFDLSAIHKPIVSATFQAGLTSFGASITVGTVGTWTLYDVTTTINSLRNASTPSTTFADLGAGQVFGVLKFTRNDRGNTVTVDLNSAAIASMNSSGGGLWAFGGRVDDFGNGSDLLFNGSNPANSNPQMLINVVPEPSSLVAAFVGLVAAYLICRTRKRSDGLIATR
jgi:hypothetical protein